MLRWVLAAAAIVVVAFLVRGIRRSEPSPEQLLARAYEAGRTWQSRFPGAAHSPLRSLPRGVGESDADLSDAWAEISRALTRDPGNQRWLQLKGRARILRREYDMAVDTLEPLERTGSLLLDLGAAFLERGVAQGQAADYEKSIEHLSEVLKKEPNNALARFNRALALQGLYLWDRAAEDWSSYLELDSRSGWADEAREYLRQIEEKKHQTRGIERARDVRGRFRGSPS